MPDRSSLTLTPELREKALETAELLAEIVRGLPRHEAFRKICWIAQNRLRKCYSVTRREKQILVLEYIGEHYRSIGDICERLYYPRRDVETLLESLIAAGVVTVRKQPPIGGIGRKVRVFRIRKGLDLFTAKSELNKKSDKN